MYGKGKGISASAIPWRRKAPSWLKMKGEDVVDHICKLAKKGTTLETSEFCQLLSSTLETSEVYQLLSSTLETSEVCQLLSSTLETSEVCQLLSSTLETERVKFINS
jgi:hypothetical protein